MSYAKVMCVVQSPLADFDLIALNKLGFTWKHPSYNYKYNPLPKTWSKVWNRAFFFEFLSLDGAPIPADASMLKFERVVEGNNRALIVKNVTKELGFNLVRLKAAKFISYRDYEAWAKLYLERRVKGFSRLLTRS